MSDPALYYEAAQTLVPAVALTDSGDHIAFNSAAALWSARSGKTPTIMPNGTISGGVITPAASGTNNYVDISEWTGYLNGAEVTVAADTDVEISRGADADIYRTCSVTVSAGEAFVVVAGTDHTATSETRDATGGPPLIATDSVEIGQVRTTAVADAAIDSDEIYQVPGTHKEMALFPMYTIDYCRVSNGALGVAGVDMAAALPLIHTGSVAKAIYAQYYTPTAALVGQSSEFSRPANSKSVSSEEYYGGTRGKVSSSLGSGGFKVFSATLVEGVLQFEGENLWFWFYPDRLNTDLYVLSQGYLGVNETFEFDGKLTVDCSINAESEGKRIIA